MPVFSCNFKDIILFVEGCIVHNQFRLWPQFFKKMTLKPFIEPNGIRASFEQNRRKQLSASFSCDQACAWTAVSATLSVNFFTALCPTIIALSRRLKSRFVKVYNVFRASFRNNPAQRLKVSDAFFMVSFKVPKCFFCGSLSGGARHTKSLAQ